ncbi:hypothetical protein LUZ61_015910 [Rhynchospora tenuis]|uniref:DDE Tnp4 domain-containing protein n=1 Tax=Rhynchospora tenuis TaxID=198213 RepID=A0AAD6EJC3_9POAL|nr:hypothetical protein LUZ61_015910 [Rhynchospora tenuis]
MSSDVETSNSDDESSFDEAMDTLFFTMVLWTQYATVRCAQEWREIRNDRDYSGKQWIINILDGHEERCYDSYRMSTTNFNVLCDILKEKGLTARGDVIIEEQVAMFLQIIGQGHAMKTVGEEYQHSIETVWRHFRRVLSYVLKLYSTYIKLPDPNKPRHPKLAEGKPHAAFKDALGAIDGTHIMAHPDDDYPRPELFRNRKGDNSQNVMAVVDFDGYFVAVVTGWEGSTHDNFILQTAVQDGFIVPPGRYYLVDGGYANTRQFLSPYRGVAYHLSRFRQGQRHYARPEELFNHRHAQLRNIVEKTFGILKSRFKVCVYMHRYKFKIQKNIIKACCILHNFIKRQNALQNISDEALFGQVRGNRGPSNEDDEAEYLGGGDTQTGNELRESIKNILWNNR